MILLATREVIADAEYTYDDEYHSYCTYAHAEEIDIDGVLEEACWQNKKWFTNTYLSNTDTGLPVLNVTSYVDEYGMYKYTLSEKQEKELCAVNTDISKIIKDGKEIYESVYE